MSVNLSSLLETGWFSDLSIIVNRQTIKAHKCILAARSQVFAAMLRSKMSEATTHTIVIDDIEADVVKAALHFIYSGTVNETPDIYSKLLYVADKYDLEELLKICEEKMAAKLSTVNAAQYLQLADFHNARRLKATAADFIRQNLEAVKLTNGWNVLSCDNAELIVATVVNKLPIEQMCTVLRPIHVPATRVDSIVEVLKGHWEWRIQNYSFLHCEPGVSVSSPPLKCAGSDALEWTLVCYPLGDKTPQPDAVGLYLKLLKTSVPTVTVQANVSIVDKTTGDVFSRSLHRLYNRESAFGWSPFIQKTKEPLEYMFNGSNKICLEGDVMVLSCKLTAALCGQIKHLETSTV